MTSKNNKSKKRGREVLFPIQQRGGKAGATKVRKQGDTDEDRTPGVTSVAINHVGAAAVSRDLFTSRDHGSEGNENEAEEEMHRNDSREGCTVTVNRCQGGDSGSVLSSTL